MRIRLTLKFLLVIVGVSAVWIGIVSNRARNQKAAFHELSVAGITMHFDYEHSALSVGQLALRGSVWGKLAVPNPPENETGVPDWLRRILGDDYFCSVTATTIPAVNGLNIDDIVPSLRKLPCIKEVILINDSMPNYEQLINQLETQLPGVKITDAMDEVKLL